MIDILLSTYNGKDFLMEQIESFLHQTYKYWKLYIRDDASTDSTNKIINTYRRKYPDKIFIVKNNNKNLGSVKSFLELMTFSKAELTVFSDQDDVWKKNKLEVLKNYYDSLNKQNEPVLLHTAATIVDEELTILEKETVEFNAYKNKTKTYKWNIFQNDVTGCTMMINKTLRDIALSYTSDIQIIQHDWFLSFISTLSSSKYFLNEELVFYRQHKNNQIGIKKVSFAHVFSKVFFGKTSYPFYDQVESVLSLNKLKIEKSVYKELIEFVKLKNEKKTYRIFWHLKHGYLRNGNIFNKIYQLLIC